MDDPDDGGVLLGRVVGEGHDGRDLHRGQHRGIRTGENLKDILPKLGAKYKYNILKKNRFIATLRNSSGIIGEINQ
jgi:hypothetical protein